MTQIAVEKNYYLETGQTTIAFAWTR